MFCFHHFISLLDLRPKLKYVSVLIAVNEEAHRAAYAAELAQARRGKKIVSASQRSGCAMQSQLTGAATQSHGSGPPMQAQRSGLALHPQHSRGARQGHVVVVRPRRPAENPVVISDDEVDDVDRRPERENATADMPMAQVPAVEEDEDMDFWSQVDQIEAEALRRAYAEKDDADMAFWSQHHHDIDRVEASALGCPPIVEEDPASSSDEDLLPGYQSPRC